MLGVFLLLACNRISVVCFLGVRARSPDPRAPSCGRAPCSRAPHGARPMMRLSLALKLAGAGLPRAASLSCGSISFPGAAGRALRPVLACAGYSSSYSRCSPALSFEAPLSFHLSF